MAAICSLDEWRQWETLTSILDFGAGEISASENSYVSGRRSPIPSELTFRQSDRTPKPGHRSTAGRLAELLRTNQDPARGVRSP
jgi:hypothetical protein